LDADAFQAQLCLSVERVVDDHDVARSHTGGRWFEADLERAALTNAHDERINGLIWLLQVSSPAEKSVVSPPVSAIPGGGVQGGIRTDIQRYRTDVRKGHGLEGALRKYDLTRGER